MTEQEIYARLNEIFQDIFDDDTIEVSAATTAKDVDGWDSLTHITLIAEIEDEFDMKFDMKDVVGMKNVGEMVEIIKRAE